MKTRAERPWLCELLLLIAGLGAVAQASIAPTPRNASAASSSPQTTKSVAERLGYPPNARLLMIHADDVGMMHSVDRASFEALEKGWITSASIMVPCPWFPEVARFAQAHPDVDLGIHLVLNSEWTSYRWGPVSRGTLVPTLLDADGYLPLLEETVVRQASSGDVEHELRAQIEKARSAGIHITHLDSHMETLLRTRDLLEVYARVARSYQIPALYSREDFHKTPNSPFPEGGLLIDRVLEMQPGVPIEKWADAYEQMLRPLPPGAYQLRVHLAYDDEEFRAATSDHPDWGAAWRQADFDMVRSPEFQRFLRDQGFQLIRWKDLARALPQEKAAP
jgi:predicted glycoside hydrolase/deacetylase ChbG (UPF0249 family)